MAILKVRRPLVLALIAALLMTACVPSALSAPTPTIPPSPPEPPAPSEAPEEADEAGDSPLWRTLNALQPMRFDLDGDGEDETVLVTVGYNTGTTTVTVLDGTDVLFDTIDSAIYGIAAHLADTLEDDGQHELYLCGDVASDDYVTYVYRLREGKLSRAELFGSAENVDGFGLVTVNVIVDVFGTYGAMCFYRMEDRFEFSRVSSCAIIRYTGDWDDRRLTLQRDGLPAGMYAGEGRLVPTTLLAGTELMLIETDQLRYAVLEAEDGTRYRVDIARDLDADWEWRAGGVTESDWFGELFYAG